MHTIRQWSLFARFLVAGVVALFFLYQVGGLRANSQAETARASTIQLIMFEQEGCHYCELWDTNIGGFYHKTPEGKFAPLKRLDIHLDDDLANVNPVIYTPTFVLYKNGQEVGRLTGYISDDFFWGMLASLLKVHGFKADGHEKEVSSQKGRIK